MNQLRLGFTETTLLFYFFLDLLKVNNRYYVESQKQLINWLYTTSGFYDKKISGSYFDFNFIKIKNSKIYNDYFSKLLNLLKDNNNFHLQLCFHKLNDDICNYKEQFLNYINYYEKQKPIHLFNFLDNKNILIINNLGSLMKYQFESGNLQKIHSNFPKNIKSIQYFENGYTFFNNGLHENILETTNNICEKIKEFIFDGAVISAGAYSCLIADYILNNLKKEVIVIGGELSSYFGILTERHKAFNKGPINEFFIEVPNEMKPKDYKKIENGCYW
jgi:hypothetical protein